MKKNGVGVLLLRSVVLLLLSAFLPMAAVSFYFGVISPESFSLPSLWCSDIALPFLLAFMLSFGLPSVLGIILLRTYPERVQLYPFSFSLILMTLLLMFLGNRITESLVFGILLQSLFFLTLPFLKSSPRLGVFDIIPFPFAFSGFILTGGCGSVVLSVFLALSTGDLIILFALPFLTLTGFLLIWFGGNSLYKLRRKSLSLAQKTLPQDEKTV